MPRPRLILACVLGLSSLAVGVALTRNREAAPAPPTTLAPPASQQPDVRTIGIWQPPAGHAQIPIWPNGVPDMDGVSQPPDGVQTNQTKRSGTSG